MTTLKRFACLVAVLALAIAGCSSDDDNPADTGGSPDTTTPSVTSVTPIDVTHIDVLFSENVTRTSAEVPANYVIIEEPTPSPLSGGGSAGDTLLVVAASLNSDNRTVSLTTDPMGVVPYEIHVFGVSDASGNWISVSQDRLFTGTTAADVTAPEIVLRSPGPNATGVGVEQPVLFQLSEPATIEFLSWSTPASPGFPWGAASDDYVSYNVSAPAPLELGAEYTVSVSVRDAANNVTGVITWTYTTRTTADTTPPTVTSSSPANLATNASVNTNLSLTFSEAMNPLVLDVQLSPEVGDGEATWSNSGRTVTFNPDFPLIDDTQYTFTLLPGDVSDLSGNGNAEIVTIIFTTGSALQGGSFGGTLTGDPTSNFADDPTGAVVIAPYPFPFAGDGDFLVFGSDDVAGNNTYDIQHLPDGVYYPLAVMNTNGDNEVDPETGDAIGAYGANLAIGDFEPDSVTVASGNDITGVNFPLFDPIAISGTITYSGSAVYGFYDMQVGVFDTTAFDPNSSPAYGTDAYWPYEAEWRVSEISEGLADGVYYVGAFLDVNSNGQYDPGSDPAGFYGGATPIPIGLEDGSDAVGVVIALADPTPANASASVTWPRSANRAPWLKLLSAHLRQQQVTQKK